MPQVNQFEMSLHHVKDGFLKKNIASTLQRFHSLDRRLRLPENSELKEAYVTKVSDLLEKKYCHNLGDISNHIKDLKEDDSMYIMPKQLVKCPKSASTRCRLCLDGSQLHSMTSRGPNLINELYSLLLRFRARPVALSGDMIEAFFQIRVRNRTRRY